jgi:hypothetical protein
MEALDDKAEIVSVATLSEAAPLCGEVAAEKRPAVRGHIVGIEAIVNPERHDQSAMALCPVSVIPGTPSGSRSLLLVLAWQTPHRRGTRAARW